MRNGVMPVKIFSTTGTGYLADEVQLELERRLTKTVYGTIPVSLGHHVPRRFANQNIESQIGNVRDHFVVVISTQVPPVNDNLMELFMLLNAIGNSDPGDILLVCPYLPFSRSDKQNLPRISVGGLVIPKILTSVLNVKRTLLVDPHSEQSKNSFAYGQSPIAKEVKASLMLLDHIDRSLASWGIEKKDCVFVYADGGAITRYGPYPDYLGVRTASVHKDHPKGSSFPTIVDINGDVKGMHCIVVDDEGMTGTTAIGDAKLLKERGAKSVTMAFVHGVLMSTDKTDAELIKTLDRSPIDRFILTDTIPCRDKLAGHEKFTVLSVAPLLAEAIGRIITGGSLTELLQYESVKLYRPS